MQRYWSGLAVAGMIAGTAVLTAQSQNPVNTPPADVASPPGVQRAPDSSPSAQARTGNTVTVSGCIQSAEPWATAGNTTGASRDTARNNPNAGAAAGGAGNPNAGAAAGGGGNSN